MKWLLSLCLLLAALRAGELEDAMRLLTTGKVDEGLASLKKLGEQGNVQAQLLLGKAYEGSKITAADFAEAMKWYRLASAQGSGEASAGIAGLYESGQGVTASTEEARKWWELAATQGWDQQELTVECLRLTAFGDLSNLTCNSPTGLQSCPPPAEMDLLKQAGLRGTLVPFGGGVRSRKGPKARALIVIRSTVRAKVELKQPRHATAAFVQSGNTWRHYPPGVPLLDREITIGPQEDHPNYIVYTARDVDGSTTSGGCGVQP